MPPPATAPAAPAPTAPAAAPVAIAAEPTPDLPVLDLFALTDQVALVTGASRGPCPRPLAVPCIYLQSPASKQIQTRLQTNPTRRPNTGIGAAIALALSQAGAHLILVLRSPASDTATLDAIRARGGTASVVYAELADRAQVTALFPDALATLRRDTGRARIDVFVHAAGIQRRAPAVAFPDEAWDEVRARFFLSRARGAAARRLTARRCSPST